MLPCRGPDRPDAPGRVWCEGRYREFRGADHEQDGDEGRVAAPLPALYGLDPGVVIYLGSTTKTFTPALRVGWLAARSQLVTTLAQTADRLDAWATGPAQHAVLTLLTSGDLERHIRRMRHEYARRRAALSAVFHDGRAGHLLGGEAGLHVVLHTSRDAEADAATASQQGVAVGTLTRFYAGPVTSNGLVIGYGGAPRAQVARGSQILRQILTGATES